MLTGSDPLDMYMADLIRGEVQNELFNQYVQTE